MREIQFFDAKAYTVATKYWHQLTDGRIQCDVCPRACKLHNGQRGACFVRGCEQQQVLLYSYGKSSGFAPDPIEKKPLNHFLPGSKVLSFGTAGCNLACKFCQNWDMSKSREMDTLCASAMPTDIAAMALRSRCASIAYTYNDPVIFLEYAIDTAQACREQGLKSVAVTAGYMEAKPREDFFRNMDAANVDLKGFTQRFYKSLCAADLNNILETLCYIKHETNVWLEITTLLIPGENDSDTELHELCGWIMEKLGSGVPLHFTAFHPDWKMRDKAHTPHATLSRARKIALNTGLNYVYTGNVNDSIGGSTYCPNCKKCLIERDWYKLGDIHLKVNKNTSEASCAYCGVIIEGIYSSANISTTIST
ncbi:pyruvate formate lyase activating enzyme [Alteromonadaceae bacterium Bs31]|nr:pyruvate formate lyase activating enzyme [Alteromonadaceae bacterium Bs31]